MKLNITISCELVAASGFLHCFLEYGQGYYFLLRIFGKESDFFAKRFIGILEGVYLPLVTGALKELGV